MAFASPSVAVTAPAESDAATITPTDSGATPFVTNSEEFVKNLFPNPLESYASINFLWTMSCLTKEQFNNPQTYRGDTPLENIIFSSAGRFDKERVRIFEGTPEYFIENFRITSIIAPNPKISNTNAVRIEFEVFEPYSMGLFFQSLQVAARKSNFVNYLAAPFLLKLDFVGYNDQGIMLTPKSNSFVKPKFFVLKLTQSSFTVTAGGSRYQVAAVPYNHEAYSDQQTTLYNDISIVSDDGTVDSILNSGPRSLAAVLNNIEQEHARAGKICVPNQYKIEFPLTAQSRSEEFDDDQGEEQARATTSTSDSGGLVITTVKEFGETVTQPNEEVNVIGFSQLGFTVADGGSYPFLKEDESLDDNGLLIRENVTIDPVAREFIFKQGQSVMRVIEQVIMSSEFVINALKEENIINGYIQYYKIDVQIELLEFDVLTNNFAKKIIFRVVPYLVHQVIYSNPNSLQNYDYIKNTVAKGYNFIYSGKNTDVIKFDITIKNLFYVGMNPTPEQLNSVAANPDLTGMAEETPLSAESSTGNSDKAQTATQRPILRDPGLLNNQNSKGGSGITSTEQQIAESFHRSFINGSSADLILLSIEILGDPFWLLDSGIANYHADPIVPGAQITKDGSANYEGGEVFVYLSFVTPTDVDETTGFYKFPRIGKESPFSGIYRVTKCESFFDGGIFKQTLNCVRMPGQSVEFEQFVEVDVENVSDESALATVPGEPVVEATDPNQDPLTNVGVCLS